MPRTGDSVSARDLAKKAGKRLVKSIDHGWEKMKERAERIDGGVKVGILESAGSYPEGGPTIAQVADYNEFGAPRAGIPERSFIRAGLEERRTELDAIRKDIVSRALDGSISNDTGLKLLGEAAKAFIQRKIVEGPFVPNAPATILLKGSSKPLIDTGQLRRSVDYVLADGNDGKGTKVIG